MRGLLSAKCCAVSIELLRSFGCFDKWDEEKHVVPKLCRSQNRQRKLSSSVLGGPVKAALVASDQPSEG